MPLKRYEIHLHGIKPHDCFNFHKSMMKSYMEDKKYNNIC